MTDLYPQILRVDSFGGDVKVDSQLRGETGRPFLIAKHDESRQVCRFDVLTREREKSPQDFRFDMFGLLACVIGFRQSQRSRDDWLIIFQNQYLSQAVTGTDQQCRRTVFALLNQCRQCVRRDGNAGRSDSCGAADGLNLQPVVVVQSHHRYRTHPIRFGRSGDEVNRRVFRESRNFSCSHVRNKRRQLGVFGHRQGQMRDVDGTTSESDHHLGFLGLVLGNNAFQRLTDAFAERVVTGFNISHSCRGK